MLKLKAIITQVARRFCHPDFQDDLHLVTKAGKPKDIYGIMLQEAQLPR